MSLQCQKVEIKKIPFLASDITNFTSAVCAVVMEMSSYGEPIFESWAQTYSADFYNASTVVFQYSGDWNSVYSSFNGISSTLITLPVTDSRYVKLSGDVMSGGLSSPSLSTETLYVGNSTIYFFNDNFQIVENLKSIDVSNSKSNYSTVNSKSANWDSSYNTVNANSSTNWNYQGTDIKALTSNWQNTYNVVSSSSANWNNVYSVVQTNSSQWAIDTSIDTGVRALTSNWENTYNTVQTNSSNWNYQGTDIKALTSNWENTYTGFSTQSANNVSVYSSVNSKSANWDSTYSTVNNNSGNWNYQGTDIKSLTSNWQNTYTGFSVQSANNNSVFSQVNSKSANWDSVYSSFNSQSSNNNSVYSTVNTNSAVVWNYQGNDIKPLTANWENSYNTVRTNSAAWTQTLSFNEINAQLTISNGNTVSLSSLSGSGSGGSGIDTGVRELTANWQSTYTTVYSNSASWGIDTGVSYLSALNDVSVPSPVNGQVLTYNTFLNKWTAGTPVSASGATGYYGSFYDERNQSATSSTSAYVVAISGTFESNGVSLSGDSVIFQYPGTYELIYSIQIVSSHNNQADVQVWYTRNGLDIPISNSVFTVYPKSGNETGKIIMVTPFIVTTTTGGEAIGLKWNAAHPGVSISSLPANTTPTTPSSPGVILTVKQVTNVQVPGSTIGSYLPLSGGTLTGVLSTNNLIHYSNVNSLQWNETYTNFSSQSANNSSVYSTVQTNSATWATGSGSGGGGVVYYFNQATLAQSPTTNLPLTAHQLGRTGLSAQTTYTSPTISQVSYTTVAGFVTDVLDPYLTAIPGGIWDFNIWAYSNANTNNPTALQAVVYTYDGVNSPVLISTSDDISLTDAGVFIQHSISCLVPQTTVSLSARVYVEFKAKATASSKTVTLAFGDATPSHVHTTLPAVGGTGLVKVVDGITQSPASLLVDADVATNANISQSKVSGLTAVAANANAAYTTINSQSANNTSVYSSVNTTSANWNSVYNSFNSQSANNASVYNTVQTNSSITWNYQGTDVKILTANWENTYSQFSVQSANNASVYSTVQTNSSTTWNYQGTDIKSLTSNWQASYTALTSTSGDWNDTRTTVTTYSATWGAGGGTIDTGVRALTSNWQATYTAFSTQSANNLAVYSTTNSNSANWNNTYSTVQTSSGSWISRVAQVVYVQDATPKQSTNTLALVDTAPQLSSFTIYNELSATITPTAANSILIIDVQLPTFMNAISLGIYSLFNSTAGASFALATIGQHNAANYYVQTRLRHIMTAGSTSSQSFVLGFGRGTGSTATIRINDGTTPYWGDTQRSTMTITEIRQ